MQPIAKKKIAIDYTGAQKSLVDFSFFFYGLRNTGETVISNGDPRKPEIEKKISKKSNGPCRYKSMGSPGFIRWLTLRVL